MILDLNSLQVESFETTDPGLVIVAPIDTGKGGPNSLCWICYETGKTVPSCDLPYCPQVETVDKPCTIYPPCTIA